MKRILTVLALAAALVCFSACKGGNKVTKLSGPEEVAKVALEAMKKGDIKSFVDTFNLSDDDKEMLTSLIDEKLKDKIDEKFDAVEEEKAEASAVNQAAVKAEYEEVTDSVDEAPEKQS